MTAAAAKYAFCESVTASALAPWHIRKLSARGKKLGGGIDTTSLCERVTPTLGGWDLELDFDRYPAKQLAHVACAKCITEWRRLAA